MVQDDRDNEEFGRSAIRWLGIGIEFVIVVGGCAWLGWLLDKWQDTDPGFMIMGFLAGFVRMLHVMLRRADFFKKKN